MDTSARQLLCDLLAWRQGEDLRPLLERTVRLVGPSVVAELPAGVARAREKLIDAVEDHLEAARPDAAGA